MSVSSTSSRADEVHQANLATFRAFRKTIDELIQWPSAPLGDQAGLVRRLQEWRKAIGHITLWVSDARAYYGRARPEIVYLLEATYDSVCAVDRARTTKQGGPLLQVGDGGFTDMLSDYIRLIEAAFGPQRQSLYDTPADQEPLRRGRILFNGLHTFRHRLEMMRGQQRRASQQRQPSGSQPVSPITPTHTVNVAKNVRPLAPTGAPIPGTLGNQNAGPRPNHFVPTNAQTRKQSMPTSDTAPARRSFITHPLPKNAPVIQPPQPRVPNQSPVNQTPALGWNQPAIQRTPSYDTNTLMAPQAPPQVPFIVPSSRQAVQFQDPPVLTDSPTTETGPGELDIMDDLTWEELEALDRSEWENSMAQNDNSVRADDGPVLTEKDGGAVDRLPSSSALGLTISEEKNVPPVTGLPASATSNIIPVKQESPSIDLAVSLNENPVLPIASGTPAQNLPQNLPQNHTEALEQPPTQATAQPPAQAPAQAAPQVTNPQPESAPLPLTSTVLPAPKEEGGSPALHLLRSPSPVDASRKNMQALERRKSLLAADVIDIDELSSDDSEPDIPLMSMRGAPPACKPAPPPDDIIDIDYTDDEMEVDELQGDSPSEIGLDTPPAASSEQVGAPKEVPAPRSAGDAGIGADTPTAALQDPTTQAPDVPDVEQAAAANEKSPADDSNVPKATVPQIQTTASGTVDRDEDHKMELETPVEKTSSDLSSAVPAGQSLDLLIAASKSGSPGDVEMADAKHDIAESNNALKDAVDASRAPTEESLQPSPTPAQQEMRDMTVLPPEVRARIRKIAEEPFINYYHPLNPSLSRSAVKEKFESLSDQEFFNLYSKLKPAVERAARLKDEQKPTPVTKAVVDSPTPAAPSGLDAAAESSVQPPSLAHQSGPSQPQPAHTATQAASSSIPELQPKPSRKFVLPQLPAPEMPTEPPVLLCAFPGGPKLDKGIVEFTITADTMASLQRWRTRFVTPAGSHGELVTVELACYPKDAFYPLEGETNTPLQLNPNAQTRTWPNGGILWAFVNNEKRSKEQEIRMFLSPPPFVLPNESVDISDFVQTGANTVKFLHLGGMANFVFVVQARKMAPPSATWPSILKIVKQIPLHLERPSFVNLLNQLNTPAKTK